MARGQCHSTTIYIRIEMGSLLLISDTARREHRALDSHCRTLRDLPIDALILRILVLAATGEDPAVKLSPANMAPRLKNYYVC